MSSNSKSFSDMSSVTRRGSTSQVSTSNVAHVTTTRRGSTSQIYELSSETLGEAAVRRGEMKRRRQSGERPSVDHGDEGGLVGLLSRSSSLVGRLTDLLPTFSRTTTDSGIYSRRSSNHTSRRSSVHSLGDTTEGEEEPLVNVYPGGCVEDDYRMRQMLGEGAFSKVYLAESKMDQGGLVAVKVINKAELCSEEDKMFLVDKEIEIMSQLDHSNLVRLYEVYENKEEVCLVMELAKGGELFDHLVDVGNLSEPESARIFSQLLAAVRELHFNGIVHRDIKPENLLFYDNKTDSRLLLADFGLSDYQEELTSDSPLAGTPTYLAPEVIAGCETPTMAQDLWSCGVILFVMLCGYPPFFCPDDTESGVLRSVVRGRYTFHPAFWDSVSDDAKDLVSRLLCLDPTQRLTPDQALCHPWIMKHQTRSHPHLSLLHLAGLLVILIILTFLYFLLLSEYFNVPLADRNMGDNLATFWNQLSAQFLIFSMF